MWQTIGRYRLTGDVRVVVQVGTRGDPSGSPKGDDTPDVLTETSTTLRKLARLLQRLTKP